MFAALDESITEARLALAQKIYTVLWIILTIPLAVYFIMDEAWLNTIYQLLANYCASALILFSTILFQFQAFYLAYVIFSSKKNKKDPNVVKSITSTVLINLAMVLLDWIALGVQFYQLIALNDRKFFWWATLCLQFSTAIAALHGSLSIFIFLQFKKLAFVGTAVGAKLKKKSMGGTAVGAKLKKKSLGGTFNLKIMHKSKLQQGPSSPIEISPIEILPTASSPPELLSADISPTEISPSPTRVLTT
jgi:hypothetical protein